MGLSWQNGMITCKSLVPGKAFGIGIIISYVQSTDKKSSEIITEMRSVFQYPEQHEGHW